MGHKNLLGRTFIYASSMNIIPQARSAEVVYAVSIPYNDYVVIIIPQARSAEVVYAVFIPYSDYTVVIIPHFEQSRNNFTPTEFIRFN